MLADVERCGMTYCLATTERLQSHTSSKLHFTNDYFWVAVLLPT
jgi:hypothetical protein